MNILLTGATGFIGSHVARALLARGHDVHAVVLPRDNLCRIADIQSSIHFIAGDLLESTFSLPASSFDCCVHLAWYVEPGKYLESPLNRDFVRASLRLANMQFARFVAAGTCFEYDTDTGRLSENSPTKPRSLYAQCKLELLEKLQALGMEMAWVRFFYQYGPWEDPRRLMPYVINKLLRGQVCPLTPGDQIRDFLHVEDVASAVVAVAESNLTGPVNIGSGEPITVREIAETIGRQIGRSDLIRLGAQPHTPGDPMKILADNAKLRNTGWLPRFKLDAGLRSTIEWWRQNPPPS